MVNFCQRFQRKKWSMILIKKNPVMICMLLHLCTTILKVDWPIIVNVQNLKEAKTKQLDIKLLIQKVRKWILKGLFC